MLYPILKIQVQEFFFLFCCCLDLLFQIRHVLHGLVLIQDGLNIMTDHFKSFIKISLYLPKNRFHYIDRVDVSDRFKGAAGRFSVWIHFSVSMGMSFSACPILGSSSSLQIPVSRYISCPASAANDFSGKTIPVTISHRRAFSMLLYSFLCSVKQLSGNDGFMMILYDNEFFLAAIVFFRM